jgi:PqqD family protein of HPr-rel-A system
LPGQSWRLIPGADLSWRAWDSEYVVYNDLTGHTHRLDYIAGQVLEALVRGPTDLTELARRLADILDVAPTQQLLDSLDKIVQEFLRVGLIEPVGS